MFRGIGLSLFTHFVFALLLFYSFKHQAEKYNSEELESLKMRTVSENELKQVLKNYRDKKNQFEEKIIVQSDDTLKSTHSPDEFLSLEKTFLSKNNKVVDHNTRAAKVAKFKNVLHEGLESTELAHEPANAQKVPPLGEKSDELKDTMGSLKNLLTLTPQAQDLEQQTRLASKTGHTRGPASIDGPSSQAASKKGEGESATDDYLENIAVGVNTLLNTKEFVFYSFYERVREKLSHTWKSQLNGELDQIFARGENLGFDRKTKVQVELDSRGQLKEIRVLGSSGFKELDRAAVEAFKMAAPFPNPPQGMLDTLAKNVSIRWDFVVMADSSAPKIKMEFKRAPANF